MSAPALPTLIAPEEVKVGDKIRFEPRGSDIAGWWNVRARDDRFIIATAQAPFKPKGELAYTVVDLVGFTSHHHGAGPGVVRSSLNTIGGGWDMSDEGVAEAMAGLQSGEWELSHRRVITVRSIEIKQ